MKIELKRLLGDDTAIISPFAAKDDVKALPGVHWSPEDHYWIIPTCTALGAAASLRALGYEVTTRGLYEPASVQVPEPWEAMFAAIPAPLRDRTYRALVKALHPDAGGDLAAMQGLTRAYSKIGR